MVIYTAAKNLVIGDAIRRKEWPEGEYIIVEKNIFGEDSIYYNSSSRMQRMFWSPTPDDLLADDWEMMK